MRLVVTIPTYNEQENIAEIIAKVLSQAKKMPAIDLHVLVSDSHSSDNTAKIVTQIASNNPKVHFLDVKQRGLGTGLVKGHRFAIDKLKADILAQMDGDLSHDPSTLPKMVAYIRQGYDLINGSRLMKGGKNLLGWHRRLFTRGSSLYCKLSWGTFNLSEYTNSYRVFTKRLFDRINFAKVPWKSKTYIIQPAFLYASIEAGAKITFAKFLTVGFSSYLLNAITLGLLNRGQIYALIIFPKPLLSLIPTFEGAPKLLFLTIDRLFIASIISIELSIIFNFVFHENWTFKSRSHSGSIIVRFLKFNLTSIASPIIQLTSILIFARILNLHEQAGLAVGVIIGLFFNYFVNVIWIWKARPSQPKPPATIEVR
ncbi:MAG: Dolichyl-phosphate beta-D-mannosyltransferase [Candidatus Curtissbacteria bacterium GW2011_GWA2_41_24]|uniref:Dolichyl-phosphate beta-D-mannosyltransferase n=1 Tax=Candidatus Curtissbacteria bacterium GW2011_GWA2_41_24 TaxID=1618411 RepID=A0A0G0VTI5_9BACT|nr:MAG: Dolichyl-phosphate beta-D-mannosyltransferase [Candidatus Curtissbacteria bacterium GW2011_GWA2_41_24]